MLYSNHYLNLNIIINKISITNKLYMVVINTQLVLSLMSHSGLKPGQDH